MEKALENNYESWDINELDKIEPGCSFCKRGHTVAWYIKPPPECPYCNAEMSSESSDACISLPWLSW